ncbi:hypothetical protein [Azospirillum picis]|uniref:Uncharacterized protein n=1 Tax=Azospirillum picis TaxID=488438 RepID=A0ABU0MUH4_9PROT|nr:hypothetical protein [Azospirillum picis]MBP2303312.1 hypothetical protein [Azospirillum picis]MDQ0537148.1 hypothetical protein [Azospirillum picis]
MPEFFLRRNDPLQPIYALDVAAGRWWMVASRIGVMPELGGALPDGGARFRSSAFEQVWPKAEADGVVTYTRAKPTEAADA